MGNCASKTKRENTSHIKKSEKEKKLDLPVLDLYDNPPINFRKIQKTGFRIGAHVDIGVKDFKAGVTFRKNCMQEANFSENNNHLKLLKSLQNEDRSSSIEKDKIIASLIDLKKDQNEKSKKEE